MKRKRNPGQAFPHYASLHSPSKTGVDALMRATRPKPWRSRGRAGFDQLVDDRIHQRLERGVDDVGRDSDRGPALAALVAALDQHPRHRLGAAVENAHPVVGELEPLDMALILADVLAQRDVEGVDRAVALAGRDQVLAV